MGRPRLTDEERLARKKERSRHSFSDAAYKKYDASKGFGSTEEWIRAAEALLNGRTVLIAGTKPVSKDLQMFFLTELPADVAVLKKAYRNSMFIYHPDHGGTEEQAKAANLAFERLVANYK